VRRPLIHVTVVVHRLRPEWPSQAAIPFFAAPWPSLPPRAVRSAAILNLVVAEAQADGTGFVLDMAER
jgi:hypothetical protein